MRERLRQEKRDADLRILKRLIEGPPLYPRELRKKLRLSRNETDYNLPRLVGYKLAKRLKDGRYAFIKYVDGEEKVAEVIKRWKNVAFRSPTSREIGNETGLNLDVARDIAYKTKAKTGWSMPNKAIIHHQRVRLYEDLICAARIGKYGKEKISGYGDDPETVKEAESYLQNHPEMLPKLDENDNPLSWPEEALKYLGDLTNLKPKERYEPFVAMLPGR